MNLTKLRSEDLAALVTGRRQSLFAPDLDRFRTELAHRISGARVLVIGGAGSIGAATVRVLVPFAPATIHVIDQNENTLAELVRDLRSRFDASQLGGLRATPLNFGSPIAERLLAEEDPYDFVLNFAALKHVRSEKDSYSILQMLDTNVARPARLLQRLISRGGLRGYFCVSTDKAANPVSLMGASKRLMEHVIFSDQVVDSRGVCIASARFANVAFSDGSLLYGWLERLSRRQPLAVPKDTRRFFVSLEEAGDICLLAAFLAPDRHLLIPRLDPSLDLTELSHLAVRLLEKLGLEAEVFEDERAARRAAAAIDGSRRYPLLVTPRDTGGEKPYEEFVGSGEQSLEVGMLQALAVPYLPGPAGTLAPFLEWIEGITGSPHAPVSKEDLVREIGSLLPEFRHAGSTKSLDHRL